MADQNLRTESRFVLKQPRDGLFFLLKTERNNLLCYNNSMEKDFDKWNNQKKIINLRSNNTDFFYHEREVWWCAIGVNVGFE